MTVGRFRIEISYTKYHWESFKIREQEQYINFKRLINNYPQTNLQKVIDNIEEQNEIRNGIIIEAAFCFSIITICFLFGFNDITYFILFCMAFPLIGIVVTFYYYLRLIIEKREYYKKLKNDILLSKNFEDFLEKRREKYLLIK